MVRIRTMGVLQSTRQRNLAVTLLVGFSRLLKGALALPCLDSPSPVTYPPLKLCEEVVGGFLAYRGRDSSPATWRVFAGGPNQAFLVKHPFDASGLHPWHCPRGMGHSEVLNSHPLCAGLHRPAEFPPNPILGNSLARSVCKNKSLRV